jgi:N-acyl-D-amino-acid deacylase
MTRFLTAWLLLLLAAAMPARAEPQYDLVIRGGTVYDGGGGEGQIADVAVSGDHIVKIGQIDAAEAKQVIDAQGKAVAPGFINMLSWATESLLADGRAVSDIKQGVTLEIFGEGTSMGPINSAMRAEMIRSQTDIKFEVPWTSFGEYLEHLETRGIGPNVASFVGATSVRIHVLGYEDRKAMPAELAQMQQLVREGMLEGALGVGSSLIYAPASYSDTDELIALAKAASPFGGRYISHMRSEGDHIDKAVDELIRIGREGGVGAEIYHLKFAGEHNWPRYDEIIAKIEAARAAGQDVTTNMYNYTAGATGLDAAMPPWVQEGGTLAWIERLKDPAIRARVIQEMRGTPKDWESLARLAGSPDRILLIGFGNPALKHLTGKSLAEVSAMRGTTPEDTMIDLVIEDGTRVGTAYFLMSEDNVRKQIQLPYMAFGSDAEAPATEGAFLLSNAHPRAYGNVARLLGRYVRDEKLISLGEAVRRLTYLPATNLKLRGRGRLVPGYFADVVVFDPLRVGDHATFDKPHQYSVGMEQVFVNGIQVLKDGEPTGKAAGRVVRGPGWTGWGQRKETK